VPSQKLPEHLGLGITEFGKLACGIHHRAMVLTQLSAIAGQWFDRRRKSLLAETIGHFMNSRRTASNCRVRNAQKAPCPIVGELLDRFPSVPLGEEPQGLEREGVIGLFTRRSTGTGEGENLAGPTAPRTWLGSVGHLVRCLDQPCFLQRFEWPAHRCSGRSQLLRERSGCTRPALGEAPRNALCGFGREFHNIIVS